MSLLILSHTDRHRMMMADWKERLRCGPEWTAGSLDIRLEHRTLHYIGPYNPSEWCMGGVWDEQARDTFRDGKDRPKNKLRVICTLDDIGKHGDNPQQGGKLLHLSVSYANKLPTWDDLRLVRAGFFRDDIDAMMVMPQEKDYINTHQFTFHLWEIPKEWGIR